MQGFFTRIAVAAFLLLAAASQGRSLEVNGYTLTHNSRWLSGFPSNPIENTSSDFLGAAYDWSGVGWVTNNTSQNVTMLNSKFFLYAKHYTPSGSIAFLTSNDELESYAIGAVSGSLNGDLAVGVLDTAVSDDIASYSILFKGYSANSYVGTDLLVYGKNGTIGIQLVTGTSAFSDIGGRYLAYKYNSTTADYATLQSGDSGSPSFAVYDGALCVTGAHFASDSTSGIGYDSSTGLSLKYIVDYMDDYGYLPFVVTPTSATWTGAAGSTWQTGGNWSTGAVPLDKFNPSGLVITCASVLFDGSVSTRNITLGSSQIVTGITFANVAGTNGFTLSGGTLTIGEAGIINKDDDIQAILSDIVLRTAQIWQTGPGGLLVAGNVNNSGKLLDVNVDGETSSYISGILSGSGGLAKEGDGTLYLTSTSGNTYSGITYLHEGVLAIDAESLLGTAPSTYGSKQIWFDGGILRIMTDMSISSTRGVYLDNPGGTFLIDGGITLTVSSIVSGDSDSPLFKTGEGTLLLGGANTFSGALSVENGILSLGNATALGSATYGTTVYNGASLDLNGQSVGAENLSLYGNGYNNYGALYNGSSSTVASYAGTINLYSNVAIGGTGNTTLSGTVYAHSYSLTKTGGGTVTLTGSQVWGTSGVLEVVSGAMTLAPVAASTVSFSQLQILINANAKLEINAADVDPLTDSSNSSMHASIVTGNGSDLIIAAGTATVTSLTGTGDTTIASGATLIVADKVSLTDGVIAVQNGGGIVFGSPYESIASSPASNIVSVPEPSVWILLALGSALLLRLHAKQTA